jgi:hypothetical protein
VPGETEGFAEKLDDKLKERIEYTPTDHEDRSAYFYGVCCKLFELGATDDDVWGLAEGVGEEAGFAVKFLDRLPPEIARSRKQWQRGQTKGFNAVPGAQGVGANGSAAGDQPDKVSRFIGWPEADDKGKPYANREANVAALLRACGAELRYNTFTEGYEISGGGYPWTALGDSAVNRLWAAGNQHGLNYKIDSFLRLMMVIADRARYHPVLEYLGGLKWDGKARLDRWLPTYLGAEDTELNRASGRVTLIGAVRRVLKPGCKHDTALVLEGPQGSLKSTAVAKLGGQFYSDGLRLGQQDRETIEQTSGAWVVSGSGKLTRAATPN